MRNVVIKTDKLTKKFGDFPIATEFPIFNFEV